MPRKKKVVEKKEQKIDENDKKVEKTAPLISKELMTIIGAIIILVLIFLAFSYIFSGIGKVEYQGIVFTKAQIGSIPIYKYTYHFTDPRTGDIINYNFYVRNNPAKNNIPVTGDINIPIGNPVYLSINSTGLTCNQSSLAVGTIASFLANNQFVVLPGTSDKNESIAKNYTYVTCQTNPVDTVIAIQSGPTTEIYNQGSCHVIQVSNCEILQAIEKFEIQSIADAKARRDSMGSK